MANQNDPKTQYVATISANMNAFAVNRKIITLSGVSVGVRELTSA